MEPRTRRDPHHRHHPKNHWKVPTTMSIPPSRPRPARIGETPIYDQVVAERGDPAQWGASVRR